MTLDSLLESIKFVKKYTWDIPDEYILRQYTKLTKKWESTGRSRYTLAHIFNLSGIASIYSAGIAMKYIPKEYKPMSKEQAGILILSLYGIQATDLGRNIIEPDIKKDISVDGTVAKAGITSGPPILTELPIVVMNTFKELADLIRMPSLIFGLTLMGKGIFELFDYFKTSNPESLSYAMWDLSYGYGFAGMASSMYVKESNPKLLQKEPSWRQTPQLTPHPILAEN